MKRGFCDKTSRSTQICCMIKGRRGRMVKKTEHQTMCNRLDGTTERVFERKELQMRRTCSRHPGAKLGLLMCVVVVGADCTRGSVPISYVFDDGFLGRLKLVEDANIGMEFNGVYIAQQVGSSMIVPKGYLNSGESISVASASYKSGRKVPFGDQHNLGAAAIRGIGIDSEFGWYIKISKK